MSTNSSSSVIIAAELFAVVNVGFANCKTFEDSTKSGDIVELAKMFSSKGLDCSFDPSDGLLAYINEEIKSGSKN